MELKLLEDFLCLNDTRNFSRAAEVRNITQSTLSKRIRALEQWVGSSLIDRSSYPIELTTEGKAMVPQARELVAIFQGMRAGVRALSNPACNTVRIGSLHTLRITFMPHWQHTVEALTGKFDIELTGNHIAYAQTLRQFRNCESELLMTYVHPSVPDGLDNDAFESLLMAQERIIPVSAPGTDGEPLHRIGNGGMIRYLSYGTSSFFAQALAPMLNERPLALNVMASNAMSVGLLSLAEVGCGVAWIPETLMATQLATGRLVPAGGPEWYLNCEVRLFRHRREARPLAQKIWNASRRMRSASVRMMDRDQPEAAYRQD